MFVKVPNMANSTMNLDLPSQIAVVVHIGHSGIEVQAEQSLLISKANTLCHYTGDSCASSHGQPTRETMSLEAVAMLSTRQRVHVRKVCRVTRRIGPLPDDVGVGIG